MRLLNRFPTRRLTVALLAGLALSAMASSSDASQSEIVVGMSAALSGPSSQLGRGMRLGIEACFKKINEAGGIAGNRLRLKVMDDSYQADPVRENMLQLIDREQVLAVVGSVGSAGAGVAVPIANSRKVLLFGAFSGADLLRHSPPDRYVINFRASYAEETDVMVRGLLKRGIKPQQIAFFTQNDAFGDSGYAGAVRALRELGFEDAKQLAHGRYPRGTLDVQDGLLAILQAKVRPRAVIMVGSYGACAKFIRLAKQLLPRAIFLNVSFVGSEALTRALADEGDGVIITQVVPHYDSNLPGAAEYRQALRRYAPEAKYDFVSLEGYLVAKTFAEGVRKVGGRITRETIVDAFEAMPALDIGIGVPLRFGPKEHQGSHHVWVTKIQNQKLVPVEW